MTGPSDAPPASDQSRSRPVLVLLTSHWVTMLGFALVATAFITWLFVLPLQVRGHSDNPYVGIIVFLIVPAIFLAGLALVPLGIFLGKRRIRNRIIAEVMDRRAALRRFLIFLGVTALINIVIGTQLTYRAVEHMESVQFCGQSCHVMKPEFIGHEDAPHARVMCVECHVSPGVGGWIESKMSGTRQLIEVMLDDFPRPIPSALETDRLVPAKETCENCHSPGRPGSVRVRVIPAFGDDEANTPAYTALTMLIGGSILPGIHGAHVGPGNEIRYKPADGKRQTIPWVEYKNTRTGETRTFLADGTKAESLATLPTYAMQCVDCHNRPTHAFELPERAVDRALATGFLPSTLPFIRQQSVAILKTEYASTDEAAHKIPAALQAYYQQTYPDVYAQRTADIANAGNAVLGIYNRNVFPDLKVTWGTYPNNLGHTDFPGCFRCHDGSHSTADGKTTITQDCNTCHVPLAVSETAPAVLQSLGLQERISALRKP